MAILHVSEGGERPKYIPAIFFGAEIGFHAPQGEQDPAFDSEFIFNGVKGFRPFSCLELRVGDTAIGDNRVHIVSDGLAVFRLALCRGDHALIGRDAFERGVERGPADAFGLRVGPQLGSEGRKGLLLRARCALEKKTQGPRGSE